jgi:hypothetical protein
LSKNPTSDIQASQIKREASQPQQEDALDHKWYSFYMGEEWNS